ncbi:uncharacterized protein N7498_004456 [Penicillium cinerascens]|uniref:Uncharacterized protein n=1 Tax=Penicillium cinerascens TaxID=70096 RepID=A0A9W9T8V0_9EURO|nr:uncharacterized protein N7498_004456 [Penicillium cinerascens]KAJ5212810.1 hypothetical protein N7498_004456 [Penicillium cinerascens]
MHAPTTARNSAPGKTLLLFGPQIPRLIPSQMLKLRATILRDRVNLGFLYRIVHSLPSLWDSIHQTCPALRQLPGSQKLNQLVHFLDTGEILGMETPNNILLVPLTVLAHMVEYLQTAPQPTDIQGFCTGFLTAAAVSTAQSRLELDDLVSRALALAVCIGAVIDLDELSQVDPLNRSATLSVHWSSDAERQHLESVLKRFPEAYISCVTDRDRSTVTLPVHDKSLFNAQLVGTSLEVSSVGLCGRYHLPERREVVDQVKQLCKQDPAFQLPSTDNLGFLLRSTSDGKVIGSGFLHDIALESILVQTCQWYATVAQVMDAQSGETLNVVSIGGPGTCPRSLAWEPTPFPNENHRSNGTFNESAALSSGADTPDGNVADFPVTAAGSVAVIGMACRFPQAASLQEFWDLIASGRNAVGPLPESRFKSAQLNRQPKGPFWGNFLQEPDAFDHRFFKISSREAESMDPQQRLLLQGQWIMKPVASQDATAFSAMGTLRAFISGRALQTNECSVAVAGGVNVITAPSLYQNLGAASFLSPTGASKVFDAKGDGYCVAIKDSDPIIGVIAGSAVNQGSNCRPITVPDSDSQINLYRQALAAGDIHPTDVSYVEVHGTGTPVGDPIECESIRYTFGGHDRPEKLLIGSVKDVIGHTEAASGVAGCIETLLMMQNGIIPKQPNFNQLNPKIPHLESDKLSIADRSQPWTSKARTALVNNYGAAGSNAAIVLQQYSPTRSQRALLPMTTVEDMEYPFVLTAKTSDSLRVYSSAFVADIAWNLARKQSRDLDYIHTSTATSLSNLSLQLEAVASGTQAPTKLPNPSPPVVLCFGGQTGLTVNISQYLLEQSPAMQRHLARCDEVCQTLGLPSLFPGIFDPASIEDLPTLHARLFSVQYASAKAWIETGLQVACMLGHSFGQLTALCVANSMDLADGIRLVTDLEGVKEDIDAVLTKAKALGDSVHIDIACYNSPRNIVLTGGMDSIQALEPLCRASGVLKVTRLKNSHAYHSALADPILSSLRALAESISWWEPAIPVETCSHGQSWSNVDAARIVLHTREPVYFAEAIQRIANRYPSCVWLEAGSASPIIPMVQRALPSARVDALLRIDLSGPDALSTVARATSRLWGLGLRVTFLAFHPAQNPQYQWVNLPPYQFARTKHWIDFKPAGVPEAMTRSEVSKQTGLVELVDQYNGTAVFHIDVSETEFSLAVRGHAVLGQSLCPASMYFELAIRAARVLAESNGTSRALPCILDLSIVSPLALSPPGQLTLTLSAVKNNPSWDFSLYTQPGKDHGSSQTTVHARGTVALHHEQSAAARFQSLRRLLGPFRYEQIAGVSEAERLSGDVIYKVFGRAVNYAPYYRGVRNAIACNSEVTGEIRMPDECVVPSGASDPLTIDNILQVAGIHVNCLASCKAEEVFVCTSIGEGLWSREILDGSYGTRNLRVYSNSEAKGKNSLVNDILALDPTTGEVVMFLLGARFTAVALSSLHRALSKLNDPVRATPSSQPDFAPLPASSPPKPISTECMQQVNGRPDGAIAAVDSQAIEPKANSADALRQMLSDVLGITMADIQPKSSLVDLGVDSLMITEIASEINRHFSLSITVADLQDLTDFTSLFLRLNPMLPHTSQLRDADHSVSSGEIIDESIASISSRWFYTHRAEYDDDVHEAQLGHFRQRVYPQQEQPVVAYVTEALARLGCDLSFIDTGEALPTVSYLPKHENVMNQIFNILEDARLVVRGREGQYHRTDMPLSRASSEDIHGRIIQDFPQHISEHLLLRTTGPILADCLVGRADPLSLLFRDVESKRLLEDVYTNAPMFKAGTLFLARFLGRGTGGTTTFLLQQLSTVQKQVDYTFSDLSPSLVAAAKKKFGRYSFMKYRVLDIEHSPPDELLGQYDIVISTNCIHATRNLVRSCSHIRHMLRPDGILCLLELTLNLFWFDLVFGLLEGWWLFDDGRKHALAPETLWQQNLSEAGYGWTSWSEGATEESRILRMIVASPSAEPAPSPQHAAIATPLPTQETVIFATKDAVALEADIYYPSSLQIESKLRPAPDFSFLCDAALMIHGGGHVMLSRKDVRHQQTNLLLELGFTPVSVDYRLCPEVTLQEGPMADVCDALSWARARLPCLALQRHDIQVTGDRIVAVGWSTGGHLALSLGWTAPERGIRPPDAILAFYCPLDYEDPFWSHSNLPYGETIARGYDLWGGVRDAPITAHNPPPSMSAAGGWMAKSDARSRIALHMNWHGQTVLMLVHGLNKRKDQKSGGAILDLPCPRTEQVEFISPLAHIRRGDYRTPTFIVHPILDDLIPWEQAQRTYMELVQKGVPVHLRLVYRAKHLFDLHPRYVDNPDARQAVMDGYSFLASWVAEH